MKSLAVGFITVLAVCSMVWSAPITRTYSTSDTGGKDSAIGNSLGSAGVSSSIRVAKPGGQSKGLYDFGNEATMQANLLADCIAQGFINPGTEIVDALAAGAILVRIGLNHSGNFAWDATRTVRVGVFESQTAWTEGNGASADATTLQGTQLAANYLSASEVSGGPPAVRWQQALGTDLTNFDGLTRVYNGTAMQGFNRYVYSWVYLDQAVWQTYMFSTAAGPGLTTATTDNFGVGDDNLGVYTRNQNSSQSPKLEVTVYVPEPATMAVLLVGGIATLIRRRR